MVDPYDPYVSRIAATWPTGTGHQVIDGTLVFADISGFTALSERLARQGKIGAEILTDLLDAVFAQLLDAALERGGDLLAFGGDALCLLFQGDGHEHRAAAAAWELQRRLRYRTSAHDAVGRVSLGMSVGIESGPVHLVRAGDATIEHLALGPTVTATLALETAAERGQILVGPRLAERLPADRLAPEGDHRRLAHAPGDAVDPYRPPGPDTAGASASIIPSWLREVVDAGTEAEHRRATIGFVKLVGTDTLVEVPDGRAAIRHAVTELHRIAAESGVTVIACDVYPDAIKVLAAAGVPAASPDDTERMLEAGLATIAVDTPLAVHVGINGGRLFAGPVGSPDRRTYTVMGDAVNLAARLMAKARPGTVVATDETLGATRRDFARTALEPFLVKGKTAPIRASEVGARHTAGTVAGATSALRGREQELGRLLHAWAAARNGTGAVAEIRAGPGVGKSALIGELRERLGAPPGSTFEGGLYLRTSPYGALVGPLLARAGIDAGLDEAAQSEAFARVLADQAPALLPWAPLLAIPFGIQLPPTAETQALAPEFRRARLADLFVELMTTWFPQSALFVVEDAHWIDDASSELLGALARAGTARPWLLIVSRRPGTEGLRLDPDLERIELALTAISEPAARELIADLTPASLPEPTVRKLLARAAGNPLLLAELTRAVADGQSLDALPESVESLLAAEIDALPRHERALVRRGAVLGAVFPERLLRALGDVRDDALDAVGHFLFRDADQLRFRHALIREAAYEGITFRERRRLHREAARILEAEAGPLVEESAELLALHHFHAHSWTDALRFSRIAAERAAADLAPMEAAGYFRWALGSARGAGADRAERAELEAGLADVLERSGLYQEAKDALRRARTLSGDPAARTRLLTAAGRIEECIGNYPNALAWYTRAERSLAESPEAADPTVAAQLIIERAGIRYRQGRYRDCERLLSTGLGGALRDATPSQRGRAHYLLDIARSELDEAGAHEHAFTAVELLREGGDVGGEASVWNNLGVEAYFAGELDEARTYYERCATLSARVGDVVQEATALNNIGETLFDLDRFDDALTMFARAQRVFDGANYVMGAAVAAGNVGRSLAALGDGERADQLLDEAVATLDRIGAASMARELACHHIAVLVDAGHRERALEMIERVRRSADAADDRAALAARLEELHDRAARAGSEDVAVPTGR
jgi:class 3 adenylate cyclase/tetratricopeptide (TPR) repeat protein